jgi:hypothetical protein
MAILLIPGQDAGRAMATLSNANSRAFCATVLPRAAAITRTIWL